MYNCISIWWWFLCAQLNLSKTVIIIVLYYFCSLFFLTLCVLPFYYNLYLFLFPPFSSCSVVRRTYQRLTLLLLFVFFSWTEFTTNIPLIELAKSRYEVGERIRANCSFGPSRPAANITWFINNLQVSLNTKDFYTQINTCIFYIWKCNKCECVCVNATNAKNIRKNFPFLYL